MNIRLEILNITNDNKNDKFEKAIKELSTNILGKPATIEHTAHHKEDFPYKAQEELYDAYKLRFGLLMDDLYSRVCRTLGLRPSDTFRKAIDPKAPRLTGEIIWNPETGKLITQKDLDRLLKAADKFLNKNLKPWEKEFTISQASVARIIANLRKSTEEQKLRDKELKDIKYKNKTWDYYNTYGRLNDSFPDLDLERLKFRERVVGNYIQDISEKTRKRIRDTLDQGYLAGKTKSEISQDLFYQFGDLNKDWDRIVDTEGVNIFNSEYIDEQKADVMPGEDLYFIRREFGDAKTCSFCIQAVNNPIIAKWSEIPLRDENINDPVASIAIWPGKTNYGVKRPDWQWPEAGVHPNCRGYWDRYFEEYGDIEL